MPQGQSDGEPFERNSAAEPAIDAAELVEENANLRDRLLRALAEAENVRRRADRMVDDARQYGISEFARELLAVADNLQRTTAAVEGLGSVTPVEQALIEGVHATERILANALKRFGVERIAAVGERFDPNLHEAVMELEDASRPAGTVARAIDDGYTIHDRLLRPARVVVTKSAAVAPPRSEAPAVP
jgi:molecular chaperone GrpE